MLQRVQAEALGHAACPAEALGQSLVPGLSKNWAGLAYVLLAISPVGQLQGDYTHDSYTVAGVCVRCRRAQTAIGCQISVAVHERENNHQTTTAFAQYTPSELTIISAPASPYLNLNS